MFEWFVRRSKIVRRTIQLPRRARVYNPLKRGGWAESLSVCGFVRDFKNSLLLKTRTGIPGIPGIPAGIPVIFVMYLRLL
mgnify:CR=1 FL=1